MSQCGDDGLTCPCPPIGLIDVVGKKWAVCVVALLGKYGTVRFGPIQRCLSGVSPATLTSTLRSLEQARIIRRTPADSPRGPVRAYALTESGRVLYDRLTPLAEWLTDPALRLTVATERLRPPRATARGGAPSRGLRAHGPRPDRRSSSPSTR